MFPGRTTPGSTPSTWSLALCSPHSRGLTQERSPWPALRMPQKGSRVESILTVYESAYLLTCVCNPKASFCGTFMSFLDMQSSKMLSHLTHTFAAQAKQGSALPSCLALQPWTHVLFPVYPVPCFSGFYFLIFVLFLVTSLFKMAPKHSAKAPSKVPKHTKAVMWLREC